jgi:hypothetical protein
MATVGHKLEINHKGEVHVVPELCYTINNCSKRKDNSTATGNAPSTGRSSSFSNMLQMAVVCHRMGKKGKLGFNPRGKARGE